MGDKRKRRVGRQVKALNLHDILAVVSTVEERVGSRDLRETGSDIGTDVDGLLLEEASGRHGDCHEKHGGDDGKLHLEECREEVVSLYRRELKGRRSCLFVNWL